MPNITSGLPVEPVAQPPPARARPIFLAPSGWRRRRCRAGRDCRSSRGGRHGCASSDHRASWSATPITRPIQSLPLRLRKKEPWPQSCWIMNRRTRSPAAGKIRRACEPELLELQRRQHGAPGEREGNGRDEQLPDAASWIGLPIAAQPGHPPLRIRFRCAALVSRRHRVSASTRVSRHGSLMFARSKSG